MTDQRKEIIAALRALIESGGSEGAELNLIHSCLDKEFVRAFDSWMKTQHDAARDNGTPLSVGAVITSLAYILTTEIHKNCTDETELCRAIQVYGNYTHALAHAVAETHGFKRKK